MRPGRVLLAHGALLTALLTFARVLLYPTSATAGRWGIVHGVAGVATPHLWYQAMPLRTAEPQQLGGAL